MTYDEYVDAIGKSTSKAEIDSLVYRGQHDDMLSWLYRDALSVVADIRLSRAVCEL